jgi:hypothetical protein
MDITVWQLLGLYIPSPLTGEGYAYMDVGVRATQDAKAEGGGEMENVGAGYQLFTLPLPPPVKGGGMNPAN